MVRRLFLLLTLLVLLALSSTLVSARPQRPEMQTSGEPGAASVGPSRTFAPDRLLVEFRADTQPVRRTDGAWQTGNASLDRLLADNKVQAARRLFPAIESRAALEVPELERIYLLHLTPGSDVEQAVEAFSADPSVEWAEPDYLAFPAATTPNDPLFPEQWGLAKIQAPAAWDVTTGSAGVPIAIIDSGIDFSHPDLAGKLWVNPGEIAGDGLDNDNNGYIDDVNGWDFVNGDNAPADDYGHGTQVAGVAGAAANNGLGVAGVCWDCRLMSVKVMQASGVANYSTVAQGVLYAAQKGARVINLSLGAYSYSSALHAAIQTATGTYDAVVVAGAGNDNVSTPFYPAAHPEVLAVAGTNQADVKASMSNFGTWVDVSAPAMDITTTFMGGDYGAGDGTSYATPFAAGIAGLLRSQNPGWSADMVRAQMIHTASTIDSLNPGFEGMLGSGRVDAAAALTVAPHPLLTIAAIAVNGDPAGRPTPDESSTLSVTLDNDWLDATGVAATLTTSDPYVTVSQGSASFDIIAAGGTGTGSPLFAFAVAAAAGYNHAIPFILHVTANGGAYATDLSLTLTTRSADEYVGGTISVNTTWTSDKRYIVTSNVGVAPGATLTIQPGTEVRFNGDYSLNVGGTLIADGTELQPIRFLHHTGGTWGRIYFDDPSVDATSTENGAYVAGDLLRWVRMENAAQGLACNSATPYLAHVLTTQGGLSCTAGTTPLWLVDSELTGAAIIAATASIQYHVQGLELHAGSLSVPANAEVLNSTVEGNVGAASEGVVVGNTVWGSIGLDSGIIQGNQVHYGGIRVGAGSVFSNTVTGGGIIAGNGSTVQSNNVEGSPGWAVQGSGNITTRANRLVNNANGIRTAGGLVQGNLIANSSGIGLEINGNTSVISNTFTGNAGSAIKVLSAISLEIAGNNLEFNTGTYDIENLVPKANLPTIPAQGNWWGTIDPAVIGQRIFDFNDDYTVGLVQYAPLLSEPVSDAPAYVRALTLAPPSPVGIETVVFDILFSKEMDESRQPQPEFRTTSSGSWDHFYTGNSGLCGNDLRWVTVDTAGNVWFSTYDGGVCSRSPSGVWTHFGHDSEKLFADPRGGVWLATYYEGAMHIQPDGTEIVYNTANSCLPTDRLTAVYVDDNMNVWIATDHYGVAKMGSDGTCTLYQTGNSGLPGNTVWSIAVDSAGWAWFATWGAGVGVLTQDGSWSTYNTSNSGLLNDRVPSLAIDTNGDAWFACYGGDGGGGGVSRLSSSGTWSNYTAANSPLLSEVANVVAVDSESNVWIGSEGGLNQLLADGSWNSYPQFGWVRGIDFTDVGDVWTGSYFGGGVHVLHRGVAYPVQAGPQWLSSTRWRAEYDFNALIPRDDYRVSISGTGGVDGMEIAPNATYTFTVDYAGAIGDTTPPPVPVVEACASSDVGTLSASWSAHDPDSAITLYRYAIGTTPGGTEAINWINTTAPSFEHTGLGLLAGQTYYVAVAARNEGGLWSEAGIPAGLVAGSGTCTTNKIGIYLPLVLRGS